MNTKGLKKKAKRWILKSDETAAAREETERIAATLRINPIIAELLYNRGYKDPKSAKTFLYMENEILANPFDMKDMARGIERVSRAIKCGERITIYGDYDVDGVTSVCTLYLYLKSKGANVDYFIPNRAGDGYGVSLSAIDMLKEQGTSLIITVDTGITAIDEVKYASEVGVEFLITDHHECRDELPAAVAVINPHRPDCRYPFKELAGVGVVFKFISAYEERVAGCTRMQAAINVFEKYADLVAIGTIADVMPIKDENRIIVSYGLKMIERTERLGLLALMEAASSKSDAVRPERKKTRAKVTTGYIGYTIAPRINAAGRIRSATMAVELFLSESREEAVKIAEELCRANKERQAEENKIMEEAYEKIEREGLENDLVIVLDANGWHHGVIGIVASRITEKYSRPTILVSFDTDGENISDDDIGKGSGRSIKGLNLVDALCHCSDHLVKFGGHELAAGLSVTRGELRVFRKMINEYAEGVLCDDAMTPTLEADCKLRLSDVNLTLAEDLQILEPYGVGNPMPNFVMYGINVNEIVPVSDGKHTRFSLGEGKHTVSAMYFSNSPSTLGICNGDKIDLLFNVDVNEWLGRRSVQLIIKDVRLAATQDEINAAERARFEKIWCGGHFSRKDNVLPEREDFATVYRYVVSSIRSGVDTLAHREICAGLARNHSLPSIGYVKLKIIIKVFQELNLIGIEETSEEVYKFRVHYSNSKADLDKSSLLRRIRNQLDFN